MPGTLTAASAGFTQEAFENLLAARDEPDWLTQIRRQAWQIFDAQSMPTTREEEWMRTDIRIFKLSRYALPAPSPPDVSLPSALLAAGVDLGGQHISVNSRCVRSQLSEAWSKKGVLFGSLERLVAEHGDLLRPYFERQLIDPQKDKFASLGAAFWTGGTLLYVPKGVVVDQPLHALSVLTEGGVDLAKMVVIVGDGAEATMLSETASSDSSGSGLHCGSIELFVGKEARLRYVNLQNWNEHVWHFAHQKGLVGRDAQLQWTIGALGSRLAKVNQHVAMDGPGAWVQVNGVMFTQGKQHLSYHTHQHHQAASCNSDLLYKTALQDDSRTVWRGMIKVDQHAQKTNAYQRNDNLMLSRDARADSIPGLEIEADDVRCTHGSTSGRVDEEQIFYAMTRGYTRKEAIRMIVTGFFQQVFDRIPTESVRDALGEAIGRRVRDIRP
jgi:Fe-S cluster assembly protein SufD